MPELISNITESLTKELDSFQNTVNKTKSVNINSSKTIHQGKSVVQFFFRDLRCQLIKINISKDLLLKLDSLFQKLLTLTNGKNLKSSYKKILGELKKVIPELESEIEFTFSKNIVVHQSKPIVSELEDKIILTLAKLIPSAALSYEQAIYDLNENTRISYRGTGTELRETLREVLDCLAPDDEVIKSDGFKMEKDRTKPTMKQKARFILKARHLSKNAINAPQDTIEIIENSVSALARSVYERGSISTHIVTKKSEVQQLKLYIDSIVAELLGIHNQKE